MPGGYLAIVGHDTVPDPWSRLDDVITRYRTDGGYQPYDMLDALERHGLFHKVGEKTVGPAAVTQSIDHYIESYHSRSGFSRERRGHAQAAAFDAEAHAILHDAHPDGMITLQVTGNVVWGIPQTSTPSDDGLMMHYA